MGISNALSYGAMGLAADLFLPQLTGGRGAFLGGMAGLFVTDARDMDRAYQAPNFTGARLFDGFPMLGDLFSGSQGGPRDPQPARAGGPSLLEVGAVFLGTSLLSRVAPFSAPLFGLPYNTGGLLPLAYSNGLIGNWGMLSALGY